MERNPYRIEITLPAANGKNAHTDEELARLMAIRARVAFAMISGAEVTVTPPLHTPDRQN